MGGAAEEMPPVAAFSSFDAALLLGADGSGSAVGHAHCTSMDHDELMDCFNLHKVRLLLAQRSARILQPADTTGAIVLEQKLFIVAISVTALVLCCCVTLVVRHCCCAPKDQQTMQGLLEPMARQSFRHRLMRESQWAASTSERQPLLSPASPPASLSPSTKLLATSPLITTPLQPAASVLSMQSGGLRSLWETVSGVRKGSNELINNDNFDEVRCRGAQWTPPPPPPPQETPH